MQMSFYTAFPSFPANSPCFTSVPTPPLRTTTPRFGRTGASEEKTMGYRLSKWLKVAITPVSVATGGYLINNSLNSLHSKMDLIKNEIWKGLSVQKPAAPLPSTGGGFLATVAKVAAGGILTLGGLGVLGYKFIDALRGGPR